MALTDLYIFVYIYIYIYICLFVCLFVYIFLKSIYLSINNILICPQIVKISCDPYGCRIIQRFLENSTPDQRQQILTEVEPNILQLIQVVWFSEVAFIISVIFFFKDDVQHLYKPPVPLNTHCLTLPSACQLNNLRHGMAWKIMMLKILYM